MHFFNLAILSLAGSALASPSPKRHDDDRTCRNCLNKGDVDELVDVYKRLIGDFKAEDAEKYLSEDFIDISQSINTFIGVPFDAVTFNKTSFITSQSNPATPQPTLEIQGEPIFTCDQIVIIWDTSFGAGRPSRGISVTKAVKNHGQWQFQRWDVEFNSINWAYNMGGYYCVLGQSAGNASACPAATNAPNKARSLLA